MATDDQQRLVVGTGPTPATFTVPGNGQIRPKSVFAHFDGSGAGSSFVPALKVTSDAGKLVGICPASSAVAAGASADVSWFPRVGDQTTGSSVLPIQPAFSGNTIVPTAVIVATRAVQPAPAGFGAGVEHDGFRTIITKTGTLRDLSVYIGTSAGNVEVAVLSTDTPTRRILYKSGYVALPGNHQWFTVGDPALSVVLGEQYDISVSLSSAAASVFWIGGLVGSGLTDAASGHLPAGFVPADLGAPPKLTWFDTASPRPYGATTTVAEANLQDTVGVPLVIGRIV